MFPYKEINCLCDEGYKRQFEQISSFNGNVNLEDMKMWRSTRMFLKGLPNLHKLHKFRENMR